MPFIPYGRQHVDAKDINAVVKTLGSDWLTQGPKIEEFERAIAREVNAKFAVAVSNGTCALHLAYIAAGIGKGDEIITTPNTFAATANAALYVNTRPVFSDIELNTYNLDPNVIEERITSKTKAIVPVHFAGHPCKMDAIIEIAKKYRLKIIEDAAHALGAHYKNKPIGSLNTDMTVFSFHPVKPITTGEGGAIATNSKKYYEKLLLLRSHGIKKNTLGFNVMLELGYNYRMTDIQAALGISQLKKLKKFTAKRKKIVSLYHIYLSSVKDIVCPQELKECSNSWHLYVIRVRNPRLRNRLYSYLRGKGIGANFHYPPVYSHPYYKKLGVNGELANTEQYAKSAITLPLYPDLSEKEIIYITKIMREFFNRKL